jgi:hypothetical protein
MQVCTPLPDEKEVTWTGRDSTSTCPLTSSILIPCVAMYSSVPHSPARRPLASVLAEDDLNSPSIYSPAPVSPTRRPLPEPGQPTYQPLTLDLDSDDPYANTYNPFPEEDLGAEAAHAPDARYHHEPHTSVDMPAVTPVYDGYDDGYLDEKADYYNDVEYLPPLEADAGTVSSRSGVSFTSSVDANGENLHYGPLPDKQMRRNKTVKKIKLTKGHLVRVL